MSANNDGSKS